MRQERDLHPQIEARVRESFARQNAMATIGAKLGNVRAGEVEIVIPFDPRFTQQHGFLHAGITAMIVDTACGFAALSLMPPDAAVLTTEFKLNLLAPGQGQRFLARGRVVRPGKKLMVCLGEVFAETDGMPAKQTALMTASMMVIDGATGLSG
ncbi:MAG: PaaI family thioesterase [Xanthobacteraceae bacterium]|nr:PaaI family thioesterase [Xanthobacteraceae bacterium]PWB64872.1 MAG: phenylacetic acid degradation protein [Bradyrhizobiaceae bacterium]GIK80576.1 MAG: thioesterase superfamily protein [Alphaproteobacteria bacterium]